MKPLLSIMLPTFNRKDKLSRALELLCKTCREEIVSPSVDFCIIDNATTDGTEQMIGSYETELSIRRIRNAQNIGGHNNLMKCIAEAKGEYTWVVGDDDIILPGAIALILKTLEENHDVDFLGLPLGLVDEAQLEAFAREPSLSGDGLLKMARYETRELPGFLERAALARNRIAWEDLIDPDFNSVFLGAIMASLVRTALCVEQARNSFVDLSRLVYDSLDNTYPHAVLFGKCFAQKKTMVLPRMALAAITWDREWTPYRALIITKRLNDLLDFYETCGVKSDRIKKCRRSLLKSYKGIFWQIVFERNHSFRQDFSFLQQVKRYARFKEFWIGLLPGRRSLVYRIARKIGRSVRRLVHG